jgi:hypothetical protein
MFYMELLDYWERRECYIRYTHRRDSNLNYYNNG